MEGEFNIKADYSTGQAKKKKKINLRKDEIKVFSWNQGNLKLCSIFVISIKESDIGGSILTNKF